MPLLFMITDKYYDKRSFPINSFLRNHIVIINAGGALVNEGQISKTIYEILQEINFFIRE